jgi:hypothetical protein
MENRGNSMTQSDLNYLKAGGSVTYDPTKPQIGDYWTDVSGNKWYLAHFNYFWNGFHTSRAHSILVCPSGARVDKMFAIADNAAGYEGCGFHKWAHQETWDQFGNLLRNVGGLSNLAQFNWIQSNMVVNGQVSGGAVLTCKAGLLTEIMVFGTRVMSAQSYAHAVLPSMGGIQQLDIFKIAPWLIWQTGFRNNRYKWLADPLRDKEWVVVDAYDNRVTWNTVTETCASPSFVVIGTM